jgi:hypothetical protein
MLLDFLAHVLHASSYLVDHVSCAVYDLLSHAFRPVATCSAVRQPVESRLVTIRVATTPTVGFPRVCISPVRTRLLWWTPD